VNPNHSSSHSENFWRTIIFILSAVVILAVLYLFAGPRPAGDETAPDVSWLPTVNAGLNGLTTVFLSLAYRFIRRREIERHRRMMLTAFGTSTLFLVFYLIYHWYQTGPKTYEGPWPGVYFFILATHIILAAVILPLALLTLYRGWTDQRRKHRKIARITLPLWLYVSVTGVTIYLMLYV
jgi:putative membrane protein